MKIVFFGSDDFAAKNLENLIGSRHDVLACVTQPDRPKGRSLRITAPQVKLVAGENNIDVLQPRNLKDEDFLDCLKDYNADIFVVIAYGRILPDVVLAIPKIFCINVHGSLLPRYRGAAPINWAIINGEKQTGITIAKINQDLDSGDVLAQRTVDIRDNDTSVVLREKMIQKSIPFLLECLKDVEKGSLRLESQNAENVTYAPKLKKEMGLISWSETSQKIHNLIRGLLPWPSAFTYYEGKILKILESEVVASFSKDAIPGEILAISKQGFIVNTSQQALLVKKVHPESSKPMDAKSFVVGHKLDVGFIFK